MALATGARLGPYEILSALGSGGMGEVYRARDTKLDRDVAVKILPEAFTADAERIARFQREAKTLAALNHPHIAAIYGLEQANGTLALVMELVDGEDLSQRIARGPISPEEALPIAKQIAEALEGAHEQGIIHRDLKPANIKVRPDGTAKVLDFGLAKALESPGSGSNAALLANSPTITSPAMMTAVGVILGTAAYMSPEQVKGRAADKRSDIWAFGCVLFEMLTGTRAFQGGDVAETLAEVIKSQPDWSRLPVDTSPSVRRLLRRALTKDRKFRTGDATSLRLDIDDAGNSDALLLSQAPRSVGVKWLAATAALALVALSAARWLVPALPKSEPSELRLDIATPETSEASSMALSPDGTKLAYVIDPSGRPQMWLRDLRTGATRELRNASGGLLPFWSPNSRSIGFFAQGRLKRADLVGGPARDLAAANGGRGGGSWGEDGTIIFSTTGVSGIFRVNEEGGDSAAITEVTASQRGAHRGPNFLPDGRHFVYFAVATDRGGGVYLSDLERAEPRRLVDADSTAVFARGHLVFIRGTTLVAQRFDLPSLQLSGDPIGLAESITPSPNGIPALSASRDGALAFRDVAPGDRRQLKWFDRTGGPIASLNEPEAVTRLTSPNLSPDGRRVAFGRTVKNPPEVWIVDIARGGLTPATAGGGSQPVWSPDGQRFAYIVSRSNITEIRERPLNGTGESRALVTTPSLKGLTDWSPDGQFLLFTNVEVGGQPQLWTYSFGGEHASPLAMTSGADVSEGKFSPDGHWVAYQSNQSGRYEVYVRPFLRAGDSVQVSKSGGAQVRWRHDGRELYYVDLEDRLLAVSVASKGDALEFSEPVTLFDVRVPQGAVQTGGAHQQYDVSADGQRFLVNTLVPDQTFPPITLVLNWHPPSAPGESR